MYIIFHVICMLLYTYANNLARCIK
jgi:hypothetical protein